MKFDFYQKPRYEVVGYGIYKDVKWAIVSIRGSHPCAYIQDMFDWGKYDNFDDIPLRVHGGVTFYDNCYFNKEEENVKYIGWDYAHCDDFIAYPEMPSLEDLNCKKWTYDEVKQDVYNAIDQMLKEIENNER